MAEAKTKEIDANLYIDGDLDVDGALDVSSTLIVGGAITIAAPSGTDAGAAWTTGPPAFTSGHLFITLKAGATTYRVPVFKNA